MVIWPMAKIIATFALPRLSQLRWALSRCMMSRRSMFIQTGAVAFTRARVNKLADRVRSSVSFVIVRGLTTRC